MSQRLINRSPDLKRLRDEGFDLEVKGGHLLVKSVPYLNSANEIKRGILVSKLELSGDATCKPSDHVAFFIGGTPCDENGTSLSRIINSSVRKDLGDDISIDHIFSSKPSQDGYPDYYEKVTTYIKILCHPARAKDPLVTPMTFPPIPADDEDDEDDEDGVFQYHDTATSRSEIGVIAAKLRIGKVAIVGLGGTGSYTLDLVAKCPVREIHLFDGDLFLSHNAFRAPGAASLDELRASPSKVEYFRAMYSKLHRGIRAHPFFMDAAHVEELRGMDFVFLCLDRGADKKLVVQRLQEWEILFVEAGMGVEIVDDALLGTLRTTASSTRMSTHIWEKSRIPFENGEAANEYSTNIQIADLNALNAALAVIKWKKLFGFYVDLEGEHYSTYVLSGNVLHNDDLAEGEQ